MTRQEKFRQLANCNIYDTTIAIEVSMITRASLVQGGMFYHSVAKFYHVDPKSDFRIEGLGDEDTKPNIKALDGVRNKLSYLERLCNDFRIKTEGNDIDLLENDYEFFTVSLGYSDPDDSNYDDQLINIITYADSDLKKLHKVVQVLISDHIELIREENNDSVVNVLKYRQQHEMAHENLIYPEKVYLISLLLRNTVFGVVNNTKEDISKAIAKHIENNRYEFGKVLKGAPIMNEHFKVVSSSEMEKAVQDFGVGQKNYFTLSK